MMRCLDLVGTVVTSWSERRQSPEAANWLFAAFLVHGCVTVCVVPQRKQVKGEDIILL